MTDFQKLQEDGKVYLDTKNYPKLKKQLQKKGIRFFAFDVSPTKTMVELDI